MLIRDIINETTAGAVATVAVPMGKMIKRPNPSVFPKKKKKVSEGERFCVQVDGEKKTHHKTKKEAEEYAKHLKSKGHKGDIKVVSIDLPQYEEALSEGPSRDTAVDILVALVKERGLDNFESKDEIESYMSDNMPAFYQDRDTGKAIEDAMARLEIDGPLFQEGKSPHKKGTKKYKKHMAAMHAGG